MRTHILQNHIEENVKKENTETNFISESDEESVTHSDLDSENEKDPVELLKYQQASRKHTLHMRTLVFHKNGKEKEIKSCDLCSYSNQSRRSFRKRV